ncbi:hypothetical protein [Hymenobacter fastidiosus]
MARFAVTVRFSANFNEDFLALIPQHRAIINPLIEEHVVEAYAISVNGTRGGITMNGQNAAVIRAVVEQFPLFRFFEQVAVAELFVFDSMAARFPRSSLH